MAPRRLRVNGDHPSLNGVPLRHLQGRIAQRLLFFEAAHNLLDTSPRCFYSLRRIFPLPLKRRRPQKGGVVQQNLKSDYLALLVIFSRMRAALPVRSRR